MSKTNYIASMQGMPILADRAKKTESGVDIDNALGNKAEKATNLAGGTKTKITYNSQGIVTAGADLDASDIPTITPSMVESGSYYPISTTGLNAYIASNTTGYDYVDLVIAKIIKGGGTAQSGITLSVTQGDNYGGADNQGIYIIQAAYRGSAYLVVTKIREGADFAGVWYYTDNDYMYVVYRRAHYSGRITVSLMGSPTNASTMSETAPSGVTLTEATYRELAVANGVYPSMTTGIAYTLPYAYVKFAGKPSSAPYDSILAKIKFPGANYLERTVAFLVYIYLWVTVRQRVVGLRHCQHTGEIVVVLDTTVLTLNLKLTIQRVPSQSVRCMTLHHSICV